MQFSQSFLYYLFSINGHERRKASKNIKCLTWSSNFESLSIVIPRSISCIWFNGRAIGKCCVVIFKQRDYEVQIRCSMSKTKYGEYERDVLWSLKWTRWKWMTKWMSWTLTHEMIRWTLVYKMKMARQICNIPLLKYVKNEK